MDKILSEFGVQPILLAAQVVNFFILLLILKKFLYRPILKMLKDRQDKIAESLKQADLIEKKLAETETDREKALEKAAVEASTIIEEATKSANLIIEEAHQKATKDIEVFMEKARVQAKLDQDKANQEIRAELADLVAAGLKVIAGKVLTQNDKERLLKESLKNL